jgi:hypothetical protein
LATTTFLLKVQHTCPPNLDVDRDALYAFANPLISARKVVEKELVKVFEKDTERHLPVVANIVRAVQRKKQLAFPKTQHISISNGVNFSKSVIKVKKFTVFLYNGEVRQFKKISFFFIKVFLYLKNCVYELFIRNARFTRVKLLLPKNGLSGLFGWSPLNCARKPLRLLLCRRISRVFFSLRNNDLQIRLLFVL